MLQIILRKIFFISKQHEQDSSIPYIYIISNKSLTTNIPIKDYRKIYSVPEITYLTQSAVPKSTLRKLVFTATDTFLFTFYSPDLPLLVSIQSVCGL